MNFKFLLFKIQKDLDTHKEKKDKSKEYIQAIKHRLDKSLQNYDDKIKESYNYLIYKNELKVLRRLNKELE